MCKHMIIEVNKEGQRNDKDVGSNDANIIESCQGDDKNVDSNVDLNIFNLYINSSESQMIHDINIDNNEVGNEDVNNVEKGVMLCNHSAIMSKRRVIMDDEDDGAGYKHALAKQSSSKHLNNADDNSNSNDMVTK